MKQKELNLIKEFAKNVANLSSAQRLKVGAVALTKDFDIICYGYNGTLVGSDNSCELMDSLGNLFTKPDVIHAEENLVAHAARRGISMRDGIVVCTHSPCIHCASLLIHAGVRDFYFMEKYRTFDEVYQKTSHKLAYHTL
jgi:dCMP deaminase